MAILRTITTLFGFRVDRGGLRSGNRAVEQLKGRLIGTSTQLSQIGGQLRGVAAGFVSLSAAASGARGIGSILVDADRLIARLETVEGGADKAEAAFERMKRFAVETPFQLNELVDAFTKLRIFGFEATDRNLRALGDTASAFGKSFDDIAIAAQGLIRGEIEPIRNFGVQAKIEGDKVALTFDGQSKTIGRNAKEIEQFLVEMGEARFAGGMARQMRTLGGRISNLKDLIFNLTNEGIGGDVSDPGSLRFALDELLLELIGTAAGAEGAARSFGRLLARGVRGLTRGLRVLKENAREVKEALKLVVAVVVARTALQGLVAFAAGLRSIAQAGALASAKLLLVPAAIFGIVVFLQDLATFLRGGDSMIGRLLGADAAGTIRAGLLSIVAAGRQLFGDVLVPLALGLVRIGKRAIAFGQLVFSALSPIFARIAAFVAVVLSAMLTIWGAIADAVTGALSVFDLDDVETALDVVLHLLESFLTVFAQIFAAGATVLGPLLKAFAQLVSWILGAIRWFDRMGIDVKSIILALAAPFVFVVLLATKIWQAFRDTFLELWDLMRAGAEKALDAIVEKIEAALDKAKELVDKVKEPLKEFGKSIVNLGSDDGVELSEAQRARGRELAARRLEGASPALLERAGIRRQRREGAGVNVGAVNATVNVDGSANMDAPEFQAVVEAGARKALDKATVDAFQNFAPVAP